MPVRYRLHVCLGQALKAASDKPLLPQGVYLALEGTTLARYLSPRAQGCMGRMRFLPENEKNPICAPQPCGCPSAEIAGLFRATVGRIEDGFDRRASSG